MKKLLKSFERWFDFNIAYYTYNGHKLDQYHQYIEQKYGEQIAPQMEDCDQVKRKSAP
jgi:hypothetical protein